jgi:HSP20 family protein
MTKQMYYYTRDIPSLFSRNGLEDIIEFFNESHSFFKKDECSYPYNVKVLKDGTSVLEYCLAGFTKDDISLKVENDKLIVKATLDKQEDQEDDGSRYVYKGIAERNMVHSVRIDPKYHDLKKIKADFENGILVITIPQSKESKEANFEVKIG